MRLALVVLLTAIPAAGAAQAVRGQLTDSITKAPLPSAFLTLVDGQGVERARTITNAAGEFLLTAPAPGTYRLRSKRIGFRPYLSIPLTLRAAEAISFNAAIDPIPVALSEVVVSSDRQCDIESGASVAAVWDEVREALAAVSWTSRVPSYWYQLTNFRRELTASGRRHGDDSTWFQEGYSLNPIRNFVSEADFQRQGYVVATDTGVVYRAPDADVLLSGTFLRTHCFDLQKGQGENDGQLGLVFTSARDRNVPDITGTLWVDRTTSELKRLQFRYIRLPQDVVAPSAGGLIEFLRLPSSVWIVRDWSLRMPLAQLVQQSMAMGTKPEVTGFIETGGSINVIKTVAGAIVYGTPVTPPIAVAITPVSANAPPPAPAGGAASPAAPVPSESADATPASAAEPAPARAGVAAGAHNPNLIAQVEVENSTALDAYALIQELRPMWLRSRGTISINDPSSGNVQVYLNGEHLGELDRLREIARREIREVRFYNAGQAQLRFGSGHAGGVIDVATGAIAPTGPIASAPPSNPPPAAAPAETDTAAARARAERRRIGARTQNVLLPDEFDGTSATDVMSLIQQYRPNWFRTRGTISIYDQTAGDVRVALNGVLLGDIGRLRDIRVADVRELRFLTAGEAQQRYGSGNGGGVIEVWNK